MLTHTAMNRTVTILLFSLFLNSVCSSVVYGQSIKTNEKEIYGIITYLNEPITDVNIVVSGTSAGVRTDKDGKYRIKAKIGDKIKYSHVSYQTVHIVVEDVTSVLNIELKEKINLLDEAVVTAKRRPSSVSEIEAKMNVEIQTSFGIFRPRALATKVHYLSGEDLSHYSSLSQALKGKFSGKLATSYDVDGVPYPDDSFIILSIIKDVYVTKNVIVVRTMYSPEEIERQKELKAEQYRNQNYYQDDAQKAAEEEEFSSTNTNTTSTETKIVKKISGRVTYLDEPMSLVNIKVVGRNYGVVTSPNGEYSLNANVGDIIQFSHIGYATLSIIVEDTTERLDVEMVLKENELDTVIVTADSRTGKTLERAKKGESKFDSSRGSFDPRTSGNAISYIDGDESTAGARDILDVLAGKVAGVTVNRTTNEVILRRLGSVNTEVPPIWDVDGVVINYVPQVLPDDIRDIYILKSLASTNRYGSAGRGGVIVVRTKSGNFNAVEASKNKVAEQYRNQDFYSNDAAKAELLDMNSNEYADALEAFESKQKAFIYYEEKLKYEAPSYADHIAIAQKFVTHFKDLTLATQIFKWLIERHKNNPEILKAVAYHLDTIGNYKEAVVAYEHVFRLRPGYAQSYRDLANAYMENNQFKKAWRLYMSYVKQGMDVSNEGIGEMIYNEMEWMYFLRKNQTQIKENFLPKSEDLFEFRNDIRLTMEWNTSEAEFELEFVNPDFRSYVFDHSLVGNQDLITDEKQRGYSSKEFMIEDINDGEWLVNITYKGNKKPEPSYFKLTTYYNWGKANQTKEIKMYRLYKERNKIQLKLFNEQSIAPK
ncbi:MAG: hypothetical protein HKO96_13145 [Flavobacteriaceae bacterium]|nr:hypothetical protein [Flavobacteriaceae bacterium]